MGGRGSSSGGGGASKGGAGGGGETITAMGAFGMETVNVSSEVMDIVRSLPKRPSDFYIIKAEHMFSGKLSQNIPVKRRLELIKGMLGG